MGLWELMTHIIYASLVGKGLNPPYELLRAYGRPRRQTPSLVGKGLSCLNCPPCNLGLRVLAQGFQLSNFVWCSCSLCVCVLSIQLVGAPILLKVTCLNKRIHYTTQGKVAIVTTPDCMALLVSTAQPGSNQLYALVLLSKQRHADHVVYSGTNPCTKGCSTTSI